MLEIICSIILLPLALACGFLSVVLISATVVGIFKGIFTRKKNKNVE